MTPPAWQSARGSLKCLEREIGRLDYRENRTSSIPVAQRFATNRYAADLMHVGSAAFLPLMTTLTPSPASTRAHCAPIPEVLPVISARFPFNKRIHDYYPLEMTIGSGDRNNRSMQSLSSSSARQI
jgi:hypothetical protein